MDQKCIDLSPYKKIKRFFFKWIKIKQAERCRSPPLPFEEFDFWSWKVGQGHRKCEFVRDLL